MKKNEYYNLVMLKKKTWRIFSDFTRWNVFTKPKDGNSKYKLQEKFSLGWIQKSTRH